ncbi:hypothetical protein [Leeuwenhoekiella sp. ZYFB001]|uniref:hypothetical protein n=1 Tax=Leeuwenhoekiella sp. ZYFB001 TaxID=2719912 RepID=UPI0014313184|nr:hypothetical protein [Leeuwenhoekiella sp. ZYFB001]
MKKAVLYIFVFTVFGFTIKPETAPVPQIQLLTTKSTFQAGEVIQLKFKTEASDLKLLLASNLGTMLVSPETEQAVKTFTVPEAIRTSAGKLNWVLIKNTAELQKGSITIVADTSQITAIESYLGPQRIAAGGSDYAQVTLIPTDRYDNVLPDHTELAFTTSFKSKTQTEKIEVQNSIAWKNIFSTKETGRIFNAAQLQEVSSKLQTIYVDANLAQDFSISAQRAHHFADADQITLLKTDVIKDRFGNTIPDGTLVNFLIKTDTGGSLQATGNTVNGSATTQIKHPEQPQRWEIQAFITGIATSNIVPLSFFTALDTIPTAWNATENILTVGPLNGKLNQIVPEGTRVKLLIKNENQTYTLTQKTQTGTASFYLDPAVYQSGTYTFKVQVLGVKQTLEPITIH